MTRKGGLQTTDDKENIPEVAPPAEAPAPAVENVAMSEPPIPEPALNDAEAVMLKHEGQAVLFEMGEVMPDSADAVPHAEVEENLPLSKSPRLRRSRMSHRPIPARMSPPRNIPTRWVDFAATRDEAATEAKKVAKQKLPKPRNKKS